MYQPRVALAKTGVSTITTPIFHYKSRAAPALGLEPEKLVYLALLYLAALESLYQHAQQIDDIFLNI